VVDGLLTAHSVGDAGAGTADTVQAYITFDPADREIVDASGQHVLSASFRTFHLAV
jgi:hypothetical protein